MVSGAALSVFGGILIAAAIVGRIWYPGHADRTVSVLVGIAGLAAVILGSALIAINGSNASVRAFAYGAAFGAELAGEVRDKPGKE